MQPIDNGALLLIVPSPEIVPELLLSKAPLIYCTTLFSPVLSTTVTVWYQRPTVKLVSPKFVRVVVLSS